MKIKNNYSKLLIIGLDGATWKLLAPWVKKGELPFFKSLIESGSWGITESTIPPITAPAWVSFQTGTNPGNHGVIDFYKIDQNERSKNIVSSKDINKPRFWEIMAESGIKSIVINMPVTYPLNNEKAVIVSSFLTPEKKTYSYPNKAEEILNKIGYQIDIPLERYGFLPNKHYSSKKRQELFDNLVEISKKRKLAALTLSDHFEWDLLFILFKSTDLVQHLFWDDPKTLEFYKELDNSLNELISNIRQSTENKCNVLILSDHGFHKSPTIQFSITKWLVSNGYLEKPYLDLDSNAAKFYRILKNIHIDISNFKQISNLKNKFKKMEIDKNRDAIFFDNKMYVTQYGIYFLNGKEYDINNLIKSLKKIKYLNKRVFKEVFHKSKLYSGDNLNKIPDILFIPSEKMFINVDPFYDGKVFTDLKINLKGHHYSDLNGILICQGPDMQKGQVLKMKLSDYAPVILKYFDIPTLPWMELKPNKNIFKSSRTKTYNQEKSFINRSAVEKQIDNEINKFKGT
jgi:predicted AlkP superfamily phosphohydrolase/phosphomutase